MAAGAAYACGAAAMPWVDYAHVCAVPYSDAYAMPNAYAVSDTYAGAVAVSAVLPVPATSVPHNAGAEPHAAGSRIP